MTTIKHFAAPPGVKAPPLSFAVVDLEIEPLSRDMPIGIGLLHAFESNRCHGYPFTAPAVSPCTIRRWNARTSRVTGAVATTAAARICPQGT